MNVNVNRPKVKIGAIFAFAAGVGLLFLIGYVFAIPGINKKNEEKKFKSDVVAYLKSKYSKDFAIKEYDYYWDEGGNKQWAVIVYPEAQPNQVFEVWKTKEDSKLKDNFVCSSRNQSREERKNCQNENWSNYRPNYTTAWNRDY